MGMVVMDEAFDCWQAGKKPNDYHLLFDDWHEKDLRALVRRDRNHPCVVIWSIGNEIPEQGGPPGSRMAKELARHRPRGGPDPARHRRPSATTTPASTGSRTAWMSSAATTSPTNYGQFRERNPDHAALWQRNRLVHQLPRRIFLPRRATTRPARRRISR